MRWPWQPRTFEDAIARAQRRAARPRWWHVRKARAGTLWVQDRWAVELYRRLLAATDRGAELEAHVSALRTGTRALEILGERDPRFELDHDRILADLPVTQDGELHEPAFLALVDQEQQWAQREQLVVQWAEQTSKES